MQANPIPKQIAQFIGSNSFHALFVYEALNRYADHVMALDPKEHERSLVSLELVQEIAKEWRNLSV